LSLCLPLLFSILHWVVLHLLGFLDSRDERKVKALEAAKRKMVKELKVSQNSVHGRDLCARTAPSMIKQRRGQLETASTFKASIWSCLRWENCGGRTGLEARHDRRQGCMRPLQSTLTRARAEDKIEHYFWHALHQSCSCSGEALHEWAYVYIAYAA
jgi:hypothetical protein